MPPLDYHASPMDIIKFFKRHGESIKILVAGFVSAMVFMLGIEADMLLLGLILACVIYYFAGSYLLELKHLREENNQLRIEVNVLR